MNETERKAAVRRVIARGSDPEAIAEAEGDFGPGGTFSLDGCLAGRTDPHQCDCTAPTCQGCGGPIHWNDSEGCWYHDSSLDILTCSATAVEPNFGREGV